MPRFLLGLVFVAGVAGAAHAEEQPESPKGELEALLHEGSARAKDRLEAGIEFLAFALVKHDSGEVRTVDPPEVKEKGGGPEDSARVPAEALDALVARLLREKSESGDFRAVAIFSDDEIELKGRKTSAIQAGLEHESGYCVDVFTPFGRLVQAEVVYGEAVSSPRKGRIFDCK